MYLYIMYLYKNYVVIKNADNKPYFVKIPTKQPFEIEHDIVIVDISVVLVLV